MGCTGPQPMETAPPERPRPTPHGISKGPASEHKTRQRLAVRPCRVRRSALWGICLSPGSSDWESITRSCPRRRASGGDTPSSRNPPPNGGRTDQIAQSGILLVFTADETVVVAGAKRLRQQSPHLRLARSGRDEDGGFMIRRGFPAPAKSKVESGVTDDFRVRRPAGGARRLPGVPSPESISARWELIHGEKAAVS
mgnify:CR=1 FL=1